MMEDSKRGAVAYRWELIAQEIEDALTAAQVRRAYVAHPVLCGVDAAEFGTRAEA
jgi:hypothetical protein